MLRCISRRDAAAAWRVAALRGGQHARAHTHGVVAGRQVVRHIAAATDRRWSSQAVQLQSTRHAASARTELLAARNAHRRWRVARGRRSRTRAAGPVSGDSRPAAQKGACAALQQAQRAQRRGGRGGGRRVMNAPAKRRAACGLKRCGVASAQGSRQSHDATRCHSLRAARCQRTGNGTIRDVVSQVAPLDRPPSAPAHPTSRAAQRRGAFASPSPPVPIPAAQPHATRGSQQAPAFQRQACARMPARQPRRDGIAAAAQRHLPALT